MQIVARQGRVSCVCIPRARGLAMASLRRARNCPRTEKHKLGGTPESQTDERDHAFDILQLAVTI